MDRVVRDYKLFSRVNQGLLGKFHSSISPLLPLTLQTGFPPIIEIERD
jgi:hypothetical protein